MKKLKIIIIILIFNILFSCNNKTDNNSNYKQFFADSTNYIYKPLKNGFKKIVKYFPGTKKISKIYFLNNSNYLDSINLNFDKQGRLIYKIKYKNNIQQKKLTDYYENGNLKTKSSYINNHLQGNVYEYYKTGEIKCIKEVLFKNNIESINNLQVFKKDGKLDKDTSFFFDIIINKDTVSLHDSLFVKFKVIKPNKTMVFAFKGSINNYFGAKKWSDSLILKKKTFYFKPKKIGESLIEIIFVTVYNNGTDSVSYTKTFLKKEVFVTE